MRLMGWWGRRAARLSRPGQFQSSGRLGFFLALTQRKSPAVPSPGLTDLERDEATDECTARQTSWTDLPRDVQWKILDLLSLQDLMKVAWLCSTMHSRFKQELDRLRAAHTSFQLDSIDREKDKDGDYIYVTAVQFNSTKRLTTPMLQGLAQAWDAVCLCLSDPQNRQCAYSVSPAGALRREECSGSQYAANSFASVWGSATDTSALLGLGNAATMWHVKLQYKEWQGFYHILLLEFIGVAKRSRDGSVKVLPFVVINVGRPKRYSAMVYLCLMLVISERLRASLEMMGRRLARPGVEPVMPALGKCEALLVYKPLRYSFSWLGHLLLHRTFYENNFNPRRSSIKEAHNRLRKAGFGWFLQNPVLDFIY